MPQQAIGLPDPKEYGDPSKLEAGQLLDYIVQRHRAHRAGEHYDVRFGSPETGLFSWASRKGVPAPGQKHLAIQQPLHEHGYKDFEGEIPSGYGAGSVSKHDEGKILVTKVMPNAVHFTTAHRRFPERFVLTRGVGKKWLLINSTKTEPVPYVKVHYTSVPAERAEEILGELRPGSSAQAKIDGAASLTKLFKDHAEVVSYRAAKGTGHPIVHTERIFGGRPGLQVPRPLAGTVLRGELYGTNQAGTAIPPQELGGILNSAVAKSLATQKEKGVSLKNMVFDIQQLGKTPVAPGTPYNERMKMVQQVLPHLGDRFHGPEEAKTPEEAMKLWKRISSGKHPLTHEGLVVHHPTGKPTKLKLREEHDVHIREMFPGLGKLQGKGVGGFRYSHTPTGPIVGEVGTGFSDQLRQEMHQSPQDFVGRVARVLAQEKLPSGALRAPALVSVHEDYPSKVAAAALEGFLGIHVTKAQDSPYSTDGEKRLKEQSQEVVQNCPVVVKNATESPPAASSFDCTTWHGCPIDILAAPPVIEPRISSFSSEKLAIWTLEDLAEKAAKVRIGELLRAKHESDRRNYRAKHDILRKLIGAHPHEFKIDSKTKGVVGITHVSSGFRIHLPSRVVPTSLLRRHHV